MKKRLLRAAPLVFAAVLCAAANDYLSAVRKLDQIEGGGLQAGTRVMLSPEELNAYARHEVPAGVRNPKVQVIAPGVVTGSALVDFARLQRSRGYDPGWLMSKLLNGERPVSVTARIRSWSGHAAVDVQKAAISGIEIDGGTVEFLVRNFVQPLYPEAAVGRPFDLGYRIEKLDLQPRAVTVLIGR